MNFEDAMQKTCRELGLDRYIIGTRQIKIYKTSGLSSTTKTKDGIVFCLDSVNFIFFENEGCCDCTISYYEYEDAYLKLSRLFKKAFNLCDLVTLKMTESED